MCSFKFTNLLILFVISSFISIAIGNIFLGIATVIFVIQVYLRRKLWRKKLKKYNDYFKVIGIFLITMLLSALFSGDIKVGIKEWLDMWIWRMMPLIIILYFLNKSDESVKIMRAALFGLFMSCCCAIYQGFNGEVRAAGFFGNPMTLAGWLCIFLPILFIEILEHKIFYVQRAFSIVIFTVGSLSLYYNGTRGAWISVAIVIFLLMAYYAIQSKKALIVSFIMIFIIGVTFNTNDYFSKRISSININHSSNQERFLMWESAWNMFKDNPIFGVGLGQYKNQYQNIYISPIAKEPNLSHAHNNFMQMLAENGIIGTLGFIIMVGYIVLINLSNWIQSKNVFSLMISTSTITLLLQGLTEYNFGNSAVVKIYWLVMGCLLVLTCKKNDESDKDA